MLARTAAAVLLALGVVATATPAMASDASLIEAVQSRWSELDDVRAGCFMVTDRTDLDGRPPVIVTGGRGPACKPVRDLTAANTQPIGARKVNGVWRVWLTPPKKCAVEWNGRCVSYTGDPA